VGNSTTVRGGGAGARRGAKARGKRRGVGFLKPPLTERPGIRVLFYRAAGVRRGAVAADGWEPVFVERVEAECEDAEKDEMAVPVWMWEGDEE
jgi:hypothetical protein